MDIVTGILTQLGVNSTFFIQLGIFMVVFVFTWKVAFSPYYRAFEAREARTTGSEEAANDLLKQTEALEKEYQEKARALNLEIKRVYDAQRKIAVKEQERLLAEARDEAKNYITDAREKIQSEYNRAREELFAQTDSIGQTMAAQLTTQEN